MSVALPSMPKPRPLALTLLTSMVGGPLPQSYLEFVGKHDGAEPESNSLDGRGHVSVTSFISVERAAREFASVDGFPSGVIPFAEDGCGNYTYISPMTGAVHYWDHEVEGDEKVALDVPDFLSRLVEFDLASLQLRPGQVKHAWIDPDFLASLKCDGET